MTRFILPVTMILVTFALGCSETTLTEHGAAETATIAASKSPNAAFAGTKKYWVGIDYDWCGMFGSDGEIYVASGTAITDVVTKDGVEMFSCTIKGVKNETGKSLAFGPDHIPDGYVDPDDPGTYMSWALTGLTNDWLGRVSPSGVALIKAWVKPKDDSFMSYDAYVEYMSNEYCQMPAHVADERCLCVANPPPQGVGACWGF